MKVVVWTTMLFSVAVVLAQAPDTMWTRAIGGSGLEWGYAVQQTTDGGCIVVGRTDSYGAGSMDVFLVKLDMNGGEEWVRTYGGIDDDEGHDIQQTADGGYIIAGWTESFGADSLNGYLIKTDHRGDTLWTKTYGGAGNDYLYSVLESTDGGYILAGSTSSYNAWGQKEMYALKVNSLGDVQWTFTYSGGAVDYGVSSIRQTTDGGYIIAGGYYFWYSFPVSVMMFLKMDSARTVLWHRSYYGLSIDSWASDVQQCADGGYIVAGHIVYNMDAKLYLVRTDASGDTVWTRTYGETDYDHGSSVEITADSGYIVAGHTHLGYHNNGIFLVRVNSVGDTLWTRTFGGEEDEMGFSVCKTQDEGYILTGFTESYGSGGYDLYVVRTEPDTASTNILGIERTIKPKSYILNLPYPNPFNSIVTVGFEVPAIGKVGIRVYDVLGRKVGTLVDGVVQQGTHSARWDAGEMPSGIYFVQMEAGDYRKVRKVVLLK